MSKLFLSVILTVILSSFMQCYTAPCLYAQTAVDTAIVTRTVKATVYKDPDGNVSVTLVPHTDDGAYPRSGWITCRVIPSDIQNMFLPQLETQTSIQGYYTATYKKTGNVASTPILAYTGELLSLEPWTPPFMSNARKDQ